MLNQPRRARIHSLDIARGFAVLWMLCCQLLDMFSFDFELYSMRWLQYANWLVLFMVVAGFSLQLAFKKYGAKRFYWKVGKRLIYFVCLGVFLNVWCGFSWGGVFGLGYEILLWIGVLSGVVSLLFLASNQLASRFLHCYWFLMLMLIFFVFGDKIGVHSITGAFNPLWLMAFMCLGVFLAYALEGKTSNGKTTSRGSNPLWLGRIFSYFGRHALFLYFFHFAIVHKMLTLTGLLKSFSLIQGILLTATALVSLVILLKATTKLRMAKVLSLKSTK